MSRTDAVRRALLEMGVAKRRADAGCGYAARVARFFSAL
jgi:hypothetical protein